MYSTRADRESVVLRRSDEQLQIAAWTYGIHSFRSTNVEPRAAFERDGAGQWHAMLSPNAAERQRVAPRVVRVRVVADLERLLRSVQRRSLRRHVIAKGCHASRRHFRREASTQREVVDA